MMIGSQLLTAYSLPIVMRSVHGGEGEYYCRNQPRVKTVPPASAKSKEKAKVPDLLELLKCAGFNFQENQEFLAVALYWQLGIQSSNLHPLFSCPHDLARLSLSSLWRRRHWKLHKVAKCVGTWRDCWPFAVDQHPLDSATTSPPSQATASLLLSNLPAGKSLNSTYLCRDHPKVEVSDTKSPLHLLG